MAKRFTDTDLWDKDWFMNLPTRLKCLVKYVRDKCDIAGFWSPNWKLASMHIGEEVTENELLSIDSGDQFEKLPDGKILCIGFVCFQYGENLSEKSPVHKKVMSILDKNKIPYIYPINRVLNTLQDKEEDKDKDKEEDKVKEEVKDKREKIELVLPYNSDEFVLVWNMLVKEPNWRKKTKSALQQSLLKLSKYPESDAIQMMRESLAGGWKGLFELKNNSNGTKKTGHPTFDDVQAAFNRSVNQRQQAGD